jgi:hypothetical protein
MNDDLKKILKYIKVYGFEFFGFDENKNPLVTAPNKQIVPLQLALEFLKAKRNEINSSSTGSLEKISESFVSLDSSNPSAKSEVDIESIDTRLVEKQVDTIREMNDKDIERVSNVVKEESYKPAKVSSAPASTKKVPEIRLDMPIGVGFLPSVFDPLSPSSTKSFITKSSKSDIRKTKRWLATLWNKFLLEQGFTDYV